MLKLNAFTRHSRRAAAFAAFAIGAVAFTGSASGCAAGAALPVLPGAANAILAAAICTAAGRRSRARPR